ncbi:MAG TPA: OmpA family protein [Stellaceae bacterium]|jgi:outer membrane protein OmpA-like peptidoglycan-associated protein
MFSIRAIMTAALICGALSLNACGWMHSHSAPPAEQEPPPAPIQPLPPPSAPEAPPPGAGGQPMATIPSDLAFGHGVVLTRAGKARLDKLLPALQAAQGAHIVVTAYPDNTAVGAAAERKGIPDDNALSQKRADAVVAYLTAKGVDPGSISGQGGGEHNPVAPNTTAKGRAQNRRIEIAIAPPG